MKNKNIKRKKADEQEIKSRKRVMRLALVLAVCIGAVLSVNIIGFKAKNDAGKAKLDELNRQLQSEQQRSEDLDRLEKDIKSDEYVEKVAREKFNLCYPDEIIFAPEN